MSVGGIWLYHHCVVSVSYTHLDVYKRQSIPMLFQLIDRYRRRDVIAHGDIYGQLNQLAGFGDVYKRQRFRSALLFF